MIALPWQHRDLSPNARVHWRTLRARSSVASAQARYICLEAGLRNIGIERPRVAIVFRPPDNRRRDLDNMVGSF